MGLVGISPPATLSPRVVRFTRERAKGDTVSKDDSHQPGSMEAALPLTPQRLELIRACAANALRSGDSMTASRIAQRFAPRAAVMQPARQRPPGAPTLPAATLGALAAGLRRLTVLLLLFTLLPNLTMAAFWLGLVEPPWSKPAVIAASEASMPAIAPAPSLPAPPLPVLSAPAALEAPAGGVITFPIALDGTDGMPAGSSILIRGLPPGAVLSSGQASGDTDWRLSPGDIGDLQLAVPETASGVAGLTIELATPDRRIVADASTVLNVLEVPAPVEERVASLAETEGFDHELQALVAVESEDATAAIEPPSIDPDAPPLPDRRPEPSASDDASASFVRPSAYVNLRQAPSSSASVVGVVAKGTKLRVMSRKRGWVQVSNPATSQTGWIYSGNVAAAQ
jgi:hypothetical protein